MLVNFKDLRIGDEVIIAKFSNLKYIRILSLPKKSNSTRFKCSCKENKALHTYIRITYPFNIEEHNSHYYQDFKDRDIFLVKRINFERNE